MKKVFRYTRYALVLLLLLYVNLKLCYSPRFAEQEGYSYNYDLYCQLNYTGQRLHAGAASEMQQYYPEGFVFCNALYGLAQTDFIRAFPPQSALYRQGYDQAVWAWQEVVSAAGKHVFDSSQALPYGAFHFGWSNYLLGKIVQAGGRKDTLLDRIFRQNCDLLQQRVDSAEQPFFESYPGAAWPADMSVAMAALATGNALYGGIYKASLQRWLMQADRRSDALGLMPHSYDAEGDRLGQPARGSSQSLILLMLHEIDSAYAQRKFNLYRQHFLTRRLGLPAIREYPAGTAGAGDIDSGPVLWGVGGAASIVAVRTMHCYGEDNTGIALRNSIELFGLPVHFAAQKRYLFGQWIMADIFLAWVHAAGYSPQVQMQERSNWRIYWQLASAALFLAYNAWFFRNALKRLWQRKGQK